MKTSLSSLIVWLLTVLILSGATLAADNSLIGKKAPNISGKKAVGKGLIKLRNLMREVGYQKDNLGRYKEVDGKYVLNVKKKVVILNFFSTKCIPCIREIPTFNRLAVKYKPDAVRLVYINVEPNISPQNIKRFIARKQIKIPMMLPNQKEAIKKFKVWTLPRIIIIDKKGTIRHVITGFQDELEIQLDHAIGKLL